MEFGEFKRMSSSTSSLQSRPKPTCCISQSQGIRIIGIFSFVLAIFLAVATVAVVKFHDGDYEAPDPTGYLFFVGICSSISSFWLLCMEGSPFACKVWIVAHLFCAIATIRMFLEMLMLEDLTRPNFDKLMEVILSFAGLNFCIMVFDILVMIEFLVHPTDNKESLH